MLGNYLIVAWRNLVRHRFQSLLNVAGLGVALAVCVLALAYVRHEWSYDAFHPNVDRLYVPSLRLEGDGMVHEEYGGLIATVAEQVRAGVSGVSRVVRVERQDATVQRDGEALRERVHLTESAFFDAFAFPLDRGDARSALADPSGLILSQAAAEQLFGADDPMGQELTLGFRLRWAQRAPTAADSTWRTFTVRGVLAPLPGNSTLSPSLLIPLAGNESLVFGALSHNVYLELAEGADPEAVGVALTHMVQRSEFGVRIASGGGSCSVGLLPFRELHWRQGGDRTRGYALAGLSLLILFIASANFVNLSLARSTGRATEIGVRKALGAGRPDVRRQFLAESVLVTAASVVTGLGLAELLLPRFSELVGARLSLDLLARETWVAGALLALVVGLLSGAYPALVVARFDPARALTRRQGSGRRRPVSHVSIVLQFAISAALVVSALVVRGQVDHMRRGPGGVDLGPVAMLTGGSYNALTESEVSRLSDELAGVGDALSVAGAVPVPGWGGTQYRWSHEGRRLEVDGFVATAEIVRTLGLRLVQGRDFDPHSARDTAEGVLVNEALARLLGPEPVGAQLNSLFGVDGPLTVVGVVADFHLDDLRRSIAPAFISLCQPYGGERRFHAILVRLAPDRIAEGFAAVERAATRALPLHEPRCALLAERLARQYQVEEHWARAFGFASGFALAIACMGLLGLTALAVERRTREIGIRKTLGATAADVLRLLGTEFGWLVVAGNVLAWPVAYWGARHWLAGYAYRVDLGIGPFLLAGVVVAAVAAVTVLSLALRAALANPVDALRYE